MNVYYTDLLKLAKSLASLFQNRGVAGFGLVTVEDDVDIERIELDAAAASTGALGGNQGRARPEEWVHDDFPSVSEIEESVRQHSHRLDGQMILKPSPGI